MLTHRQTALTHRETVLTHRHFHASGQSDRQKDRDIRKGRKSVGVTSSRQTAMQTRERGNKRNKRKERKKERKKERLIYIAMSDV